MPNVIPLRTASGGTGKSQELRYRLATPESKSAGNVSSGSLVIDEDADYAEIAAAVDGTIRLYKSLGIDLGGGPSKPKRTRQDVKMATERELTDAKLEAVEARVEARLAGIEGKLDRLLDRVEDSVAASKEAKAEATLAKTAAGNTKWNILFTGLTVLALLLAMWAIWNQGMELVAGIFSVSQPAGPPPQ